MLRETSVIVTAHGLAFRGRDRRFYRATYVELGEYWAVDIRFGNTWRKDAVTVDRHAGPHRIRSRAEHAGPDGALKATVKCACGWRPLPFAHIRDAHAMVARHRQIHDENFGSYNYTGNYGEPEQ